MNINHLPCEINNDKKLNQYIYKIISKHFVNEHEGIIFYFHKKGMQGWFQLSAVSIFYNIQLLELFSPNDIREICIAANQYLQQIERKQISELYNSKTKKTVLTKIYRKYEKALSCIIISRIRDVLYYFAII